MSSLRRELNLSSATALVISSAMGSAVFLVAADIAKVLPSNPGALAVWLVAAFGSLLGGLVFAELGALFPGTGGPYVYLSEAIHPLAGFLNGWSIALIVQPASIAAVAFSFAQFSAYLIPMPGNTMKAVACVTVIASTAVNLWGLRASAGVVNFLTLLKVLAAVGIAVAGLCLPSPVSSPWSSGANPASWGFSSFGIALIAAFWAFDGWNDVCFVAGEIDNPQRNIPLSLGIGIGTVAALYLALNAAYFRFLTPAQIAASSFPAADAAHVFGGDWAVRFVILAVVFSTLGCLNATILAGARVSFAMADDGVLPRAVAYVSPSHHTPATALVVQMLLTLAFLITGRYDQLFTYVIFAAFLFYLLTAVALMRLRGKRPALARPYRIPGYPWTPLLYIVLVAAFLANAFWTKPFESLVGALILALGIPVYYFCRSSATAPAA
jgi:APA family basic amino acid/polyamine antiporter